MSKCSFLFLSILWYIDKCHPKNVTVPLRQYISSFLKYNFKYLRSFSASYESHYLQKSIM